MVKKICLGTAQLGMNYGVANSLGKPDQERAFGILDRAWDYGIRTVDTAALYGNSEDLVGKWIRSRHRESEIQVVTKLPLLPDMNEGPLTAWILQAGRERLALLGVSQLTGLLLHRGGDLDRPGVLDGLQRLKSEGVCRHIGLSAYHPEEADSGLRSDLDIFQVPYNILDRRFEISGWFRRARLQKARICVRSPFLQGLLLLEEERLPSHLTFARPVIRQWRNLLASSGLTPLQAALQFSLGLAAADYTVLGVDSESQLDQIANACRTAAPLAQLQALADAVGAGEDRLILPYLWNS